jgi:hypothetical protein
MVERVNTRRGGSPTLLACSTDKDPERVLELPITPEKEEERRVVMSLGPDRRPYSSMPELAPGDRIEISGELEVTTDARQRDKSCVREPYRYDPTIEPRLVLADRPGVTDADHRHGLLVKSLRTETCSQTRHHTLVVFSDISYTVPDRGIPWKGASHLNLVLDAHHEGAQPDQVLLIGQNEPATDSTPAHAEGNMGKLNLVRYRGRPEPTGRRTVARELRNSHIPVLKGHRTVVYSLRLVDLQESEQLLMRAELHVRNPHSDPARVSTEVLIADSGSGTETSGRAAHVCPFRGQIGKFNGTNCLPRSKLVTRKFGTMRILESAGQPLFVNLAVTSSDPVGVPNAHDAVEALPEGFLEIRRFTPEVLGRTRQ